MWDNENANVNASRLQRAFTRQVQEFSARCPSLLSNILLSLLRAGLVMHSLI